MTILEKLQKINELESEYRTELKIVEYLNKKDSSVSISINCFTYEYKYKLDLDDYSELDLFNLIKNLHESRLKKYEQEIEQLIK